LSAAARILGVLLVIALLAALHESAVAHSGDVLSAFGTATVDGVISGSEPYDCIGPVTQGGYTFTICEMNDLTNDYYAVAISDLTAVGNDFAAFSFDNTHDGSITCFEDQFALTAGSTFNDDIWCVGTSSFDTGVGGTNDGSGVAVFTGGTGYVYEMSHPLSSGDTNGADYSLSVGSTVGWCFTYFDSNSLVVEYPANCFLPALRDGNASGFGNVVKASAPQPQPPPTPRPVGGQVLAIDSLRLISPWLLAAIVLGLVAFQMLAFSRRQSQQEN
jgi:hypothetical protein